jgi:rod shape-determining protein MreD
MNYSSGRILLSSQREGQVSRFRPWVMLVVPLAAILFQVYIPLFFQFLKFLEMPLLVVIYFALMRRNQISGLLTGAIVGLAQDSLSKNPLGMYGIVNTWVGYVAASVGARLDVDHAVIRFLLAIFFYLVHQVSYWILEHMFLGHQSAFKIDEWLMFGVLNAIVAVALFHFLDKLRESA